MCLWKKFFPRSDWTLRLHRDLTYTDTYCTGMCSLKYDHWQFEIMQPTSHLGVQPFFFSTDTTCHGFVSVCNQFPFTSLIRPFTKVCPCILLKLKPFLVMWMLSNCVHAQTSLCFTFNPNQQIEGARYIFLW